jgi:hypothetical protein
VKCTVKIFFIVLNISFIFCTLNPLDIPVCYFVMLTRVSTLYLQNLNLLMFWNGREIEVRVYKDSRNCSKKWWYRIGRSSVQWKKMCREKKKPVDIGKSPQRSINSFISRKNSLIWAVHKCVSDTEDFRTKGTDYGKTCLKRDGFTVFPRLPCYEKGWHSWLDWQWSLTNSL